MDNNTKDVINNIIGLVLILGFFICVGKCTADENIDDEKTKQMKIIYEYKIDSIQRVGK